MALSPSVAPAQTSAAVAVRAEADWILKAQLADGSIANYVDRAAVWPYLANFAAMGLTRATLVTRDARYIATAWRWLAWYQAHQDARGFVTDYIVKGGVPTSTGFMDSTDGYAGTFLVAVREAYSVDRNVAKLRTLAAGVAGAISAIEATQQPDGLTWATPSWRVKYLMDQAEAYAGLLAGAEIARVIGNTALADRAAANGMRVRAGVAALWNTTTAAYDWAVHESGARVVNRWSVLYSDSLQQAWAVAFGLVDAPRSGVLAGYFNLAQPNWAKPLATALFDAGKQTVGYWPLAGWALWLVGNSAGPAAATTIRSAAIASNRAWPYTTGNAGQLILLHTYGWAPPTTPTTKPPATTTTTQPATTSKPATTTTSKPATTTTAKPATTTTSKPATTTTTAAPPIGAQAGPVGITVSPTTTTVPR